MDQGIPRPPLLGRLPSPVWWALDWCAAGLFALLLFTANAAGATRPGLVLAVSVLWAVPVGLARRWPLAVFGVLLAESFLMKGWPFFAVAAVLVGYLAATRPRRTALVAAGVELALWPLQIWVADRPGNTLSDYLSLLAGLAALLAICWLAGNSVRQQRDYGTALRSQALADERLRIAREVHDMVAHSMGVIAIQAGAAALVLDDRPAEARKALGSVEATSRETLAGLRRMLVSLRGAEGGRAAPAATGLEGVERLAELTTEAGVEVEVCWLGEPRPLPPEVELAAFRIIQESVANTVRHAGARHCRVSVEYGDAELGVEVVDDGRGTGPGSAPGFGIAGMRERVALLDGRFSAGRGPEGGFRVIARLPL
ncbi:sensor histidine kinase [Kitasatospora sp. NPDC006697]|uniref:sensor histidine kinase n=1 Tax=Kitasatospora sp. NPDC006697 TaxID=3364020 RepID=UPI00368D576E